MRIAVPEQELKDLLADLDAAVELWLPGDPAPVEPYDLVVLPYVMPGPWMRDLPPGLSPVLQGQNLGYDGVAANLPPGVAYCNVVGVHEASTAELAVGLMIAAQRGLPGFVAAQAEGRWTHARNSGLAGSRVLVVGAGGLGTDLLRKLAPFDVEVTRVGRTARDDEHGRVHATSELPDLLPAADIVVLAVLLDDSTRGLAGREFLAAMPDGALLVNVARGPVIDTDALLAEAGRIRAALDVTDPEPLPPDHPLWTAPGIIITPHVGGDTDARIPRVARIVREQAARIAAGQEPAHIVVRS